MFFKHHICQKVVKPESTLEPFILESPKQSYLYAKQVLKKRWSKAEDIILEEPEFAYLYAKNVLKQRWKKAEKVLLERANESSMYGSFGQARAREAAALYAIHVIKGRWKEAEFNIAQSPMLSSYLFKLNGKDAVEFKNMITLCAIGESTSAAKRFFSWNPTHVVKMKGSKAFEIMLDEEKIDRWGRKEKNQIKHSSGVSDGCVFQRAFTMKEWLDFAGAGWHPVSMELCHSDNNWYWKRQLKFHSWSISELASLKHHKLKGDVRPVR